MATGVVSGGSGGAVPNPRPGRDGTSPLPGEPQRKP